MSDTPIAADRLESFLEQRHEYLQKAQARFPDAPGSIEELLAEPTSPLVMHAVDRLDLLTSDEADAIAANFAAGYGVTAVSALDFDPARGTSREHPQVAFARELSKRLSLGVPIHHPMEGHPEAVSRFGPPDGTLKIYNLEKAPTDHGYREQAETSEMFHAHNDGLGYAGLIQTAILTLDSPPRWGGYTFFQNLTRAAIAIANSDPAGFRALFRPDAITALRPRGKGAIRVTSPVLFLGEQGEPQVFFRESTGEYQIAWLNDPDIDRVRPILRELTSPFAPGSRFVHLMRPGDTVLIHNQQVAHGRTPFVDPVGETGRVLARKWFVRDVEYAEYRHVPGMVIDPRFAAQFPDRFGPEVTTGDWNWNPALNRNVRATA